jgi:amino acid transporter
MALPVPTETPAKPQLRWWDAVSIIVGIIVGATIYRSPANIFGNVADQVITIGTWSKTIPGMWAALGAWALVGGISILGALCYAELATTYPTSGGDFTYQTLAFGQGPGFLFAWAEMAVIRTGGSIGAMAYVFADYAERLYPLKTHLAGTALSFLAHKPELTYAIAAILVLTLINAFGLKPGKWMQNSLTVIKVGGLIAIIVAGLLYFAWPRTADDVVTATKPVWPFPPSFALALVFVFYAYGGWHEAAYVAGEMKDRRREIIKALIVGVLLVTVIYLLVNTSYLVALGREKVKFSKVVAADVMALPFGERGAKAISVLIMISCLGAINGLLFTGVRLYASFGAHERLFSWLAKTGRRISVPLGALLVQAVFSISLLVLFETVNQWKPLVARACDWIGIGLPDGFSKEVEGGLDGFESVVACTSPVFWFFFLMTGYAVMVLRGRDRERERPFRVPLFPVVPILFCLGSLFMLYRSTTWAMQQGPAQLMIVLGFFLLGVPLYALSGPPRRQPEIA